MNPEAITSLKNVIVNYKTKVGMFRYETKQALSNITLKLYAGDRVGIIGLNGSGKTTLAKVLGQMLPPSTGSIISTPNLKTALVSPGIGFNQFLSGRQNALLSLLLQGSSKSSALDRLESIHEFSELDEYFDRPLRSYSSGMRARLAFSTAVQSEGDLIILDEALARGDKNFQQKANAVATSFISSSKTLVFVSHNLAEIEKFCSTAIWLHQGKIVEFDNVSSVIKKYRDS